MPVQADARVPFPAYYVRYASKTQQRLFVASMAYDWIRMQYKRGVNGAIMVDIDDTLIDGNQNVLHGFQHMRELYEMASVHFPMHVVTARPDDDHHVVMKMLKERGFCIPPDRLHMLPAHLWDKDLGYVERFKWETFVKIGKTHGGVVARFGDKMWDVAHIASLHSGHDGYRPADNAGYLSHVPDRACYIFVDPALKGTASFKLPGAD